MKLDVYNTHMELYPYSKGDYPIIEDMYTAKDSFTQEDSNCGYLIENRHMYLPRGTNIKKLEDITDCKTRIIRKSDPSEKMSMQHYALFDPRDKVQEESIKWLMMPDHQVGINLSTGSGKGTTNSTRILTPNGYKLMGDIRTGDIISGSYGQPTKVVGVYPQGIEDVYRITLIDGRSVECDINHLWHVIDLDGSISIVDTGQLLDNPHNYLIPTLEENIILKRIYNQIESIEKVGKDECTCIAVDAPDKLYVVEDNIITHNTYVTANASTQLNDKTLIITPNDGLKKQWIKTYHDMFEYSNDEILNIVGGDIMDAIVENNINPFNVYVVNHQTLNRYLNTKGGFALHNFFKALKIGIKVYDEAHLNFKNILLIDSFSNTNRTWYLTATFDRSDKGESRCFKRAFSNVLTFGEKESHELVPKHIVYHVVNINSHINFQDKKKVINGFRGMTNASYGQYCYFADKNDTMYRTIVEIIKKIENMEGKILVMVPLIDAVDKVTEKLQEDFPNKSVGGYHSKMNKNEKEDNLNKDIIVSTLKSCGTGRDIKGLRAMINTEALASKINAEQMIGRLRPYKNEEGDLKDTYFFDVVDTCIAPANYWFKARFKRIKELVKEVVILNV